jgi:hypothetical protein
MSMVAPHHRQSPQPRQVLARLPMLDFGAKRAGRAVADLQELKVTACETIYRRHELWRRVLGEHFTVQHRTWAETERLVLLIRGSLADPLPVVRDNDTDMERTARSAAETPTAEPSREVDGDFTGDEWAALGEEIGSAKVGFLALDMASMMTTTAKADWGGDTPMIRLDALSISGNPMRSRRRTA